MDNDGKLVGIKSIECDIPGDTTYNNLVDEQGLVENPPTYRSEMFFDEELFARAAQQILNGQEPTAENTHPPLGKLIIAIGLAVFGYNPFGWRIMGVVFAALMIPVIYTLGLALFKTRAAATISSALLALDFMHYTMSRMGTVDTYLIFFILLSTFFFYHNYEKMAGGNGPDYRLIVAALVCFSLAFSVKWIAIFGFVGEALLFLVAGVFSPSPIVGTVNRLRSLAKPILDHRVSRSHHRRGRLLRLIHPLRRAGARTRGHLGTAVVDARIPLQDEPVQPPERHRLVGVADHA